MTNARITIGLLLLGLMTPAGLGQSTADIVEEVDRDQYFALMWDVLYAHPGDDRGFGPEHDLARDVIVAWFTALGLETTLDPFQCQGETFHNVVAVKHGSVHPDRQYIIGAHFDSYSNPGADDNATGTAGVMEIARVLAGHELENTVVFIAFDREEQGLYGSEAYAVEHRGDDIRGMVALDQIAYNPGTDRVDLYGREESDALKLALAEAFVDYGQGLDVAINARRDGSDHAPFEWEGFQAALVIEHERNPYRHTPNDHVEMPDYIDFDYAIKICRSVCGWLVDQAGVVPAACPADLDGSGDVGFDDLLRVLDAWGDAGGSEDLDGSGLVDFADLLIVLDSWGPCGSIALDRSVPSPDSGLALRPSSCTPA